MNKLRETLPMCCVAIFAGIAAAQPGAGGNQVALDQLQGAADTAALIGIHQQLDIPRGDANANGVVSFEDFLILSGNYGQAGTGYASGDLNLDGETGLADFSLLSQNFGKEGYQPEPDTRPANANLGLWLADGELIVSSATVQQIGGLEIRSSNGSLVPGSNDEDASPFTFFLARHPSNLTLGALGGSAEFDGDFYTDFGTTDPTSLTVSWFEPGSYDLYSLGLGEGDALTNRRLNRPPSQSGHEQPGNELPDPPQQERPVVGQTVDERFNQVSDLSELVALHQEADVPRGDFDASGAVEFVDFLTVSSNYRLEVENYSHGDANLDGIVDLNDFAIHSNNFGQSGYSPDPPPTNRVQLTASLDVNQQIVITPEENVDLGGLVIESDRAGLTAVSNKADPFIFFLERNNKSVTLGALGTFISVAEPTTMPVSAAADADLTLQWFQRGSYEVFSSADGVSALTSAPLIGDIDGDGRVAFPDFLILSENYGQDVPPNVDGDIDGNGSVGFRDFLLLSHNFGAVTTGQASSVPEPPTGVMLLVSVLAALAVQRRRGD